MKNAVLLSLAAVILTVPLAGCYGMNQASQAVDDFAQEGYQTTPWLFGNVVSAALIGVATGLAWAVDGLFINVYYFWVKDAQPFGDGKGSTHSHKTITPKAK